MNKNYTLLFVIFLFTTLKTFAQDISISGRIIDKTKSPLEMVQVILKHKNSGKTAAYAISDIKGAFVLKKDIKGVSRDSLSLEFKCIGYAPIIRSIPSDDKPLLIEMPSQPMVIREVVVDARKITQKRDTISYRVSAFSAQEDRTIGDVLKRLPGIEVAESGEIKYQGRKLDKFYIEGSDMLGGRYGLATNNISHKDVASIDVMENHQSVKALEDVVFSNATAMNIKLKEDAKSRWAGTIKGGVGLPGLWNAELFAMRFKAKTQSMNVYKSNNTGGQMIDMTLFTPPTDLAPNYIGDIATYINVAPSTASGIGSDRSNFNMTHNFSSNNLFKLGNDYDLIAEVTASLDRRESQYSSQTTYFMSDSEVTIEDKVEDANSYKKSIGGKVHLKANKNNFYLNNILDFNYDQNQIDVGIQGTYSNNQQAVIQSYTVRNSFDILKRKNNKIFTFRSNNQYSSKPQRFTVTKDDNTQAHQNINISNFYSNNSLDYSIRLGKFRISSPINLMYQYRQIGNELNDTLNNLSTNKLAASCAISLDFDWNSVNMSLSGNLFYQGTLIGKKWHQIYGIDPRLKIDWTISPLIKVRTSASLNKTMPDENLYYDGNIMNNYRTLTTGYINFSTGRSIYLTANIEYKDVLKSFFASAGASWSKTIEPKTMGQNFIGNYIVNYYLPATYNADILTIYGSISKNIKALRGTITLSPMYMKSNSKVLRNGNLLPYSCDVYSLRLTANFQIGGKVSLNYRIVASQTNYKMGTESSNLRSSSLSQGLRVSYSIIKPMQLSYTIDHYCNELDANGTFKNFIFSDISLSYLFGTRWEVICAVRNIFDVKSYSYFVENNLTTFSSNYRIRPRNILLTATYRF